LLPSSVKQLCDFKDSRRRVAFHHFNPSSRERPSSIRQDQQDEQGSVFCLFTCPPVPVLKKRVFGSPGCDGRRARRAGKKGRNKKSVKSCLPRGNHRTGVNPVELFLERKPSFVSFRPQGEILCFQYVRSERFLASLEMTSYWDFLRSHQP